MKPRVVEVTAHCVPKSGADPSRAAARGRPVRSILSPVAQTIYLACTVRGDRGGVAAGRQLADGLRARGHRILTEHLLRDDVESAESALSEEAIFTRDLEWLDACDALVAEASASSFGVGFEAGYVIARAAETGKRVYLLYDTSRASRISRLILGNCHPACLRVPYASDKDIEAFLDNYFC
jgi:nucleoside 2-deoxyribosyltransferase